LQWLKWILLASGGAALAWCGFVLADSWVFQNRERHVLERALDQRHDSRQAIAPVATKNSPAAVDGLIGRLEISRLGLSTMVMEGTTQTILRRAAGHIAGTTQPGENGNIGISGHRDTFFRPLRNVRQNDIITLVTPGGEYHYRVVSTKVVSPNDVGVLAASSNEVLTLVTCYPFYFVGPAPYRFIVRAIRVGNPS
jgi:sortase A